MTEVLEITSPLTEDERRQLREFAELLIARRKSSPTTQKHVDVAAIRGMFAGLGGEKTDKELVREAWDDITNKYDSK